MKTETHSLPPGRTVCTVCGQTLYAVHAATGSSFEPKGGRVEAPVPFASRRLACTQALAIMIVGPDGLRNLAEREDRQLAQHRTRPKVTLEAGPL